MTHAEAKDRYQFKRSVRKNRGWTYRTFKDSVRVAQVSSVYNYTHVRIRLQDEKIIGYVIDNCIPEIDSVTHIKLANQK